ncbi:antibiotic transporter [Mycolicibacterium conceptionense]|uniref:Antibiotic transporter n=1 Tax=Mycolicibacterium conceptionense TaxID=451644 RepID=A0A0U1D8Q6_9MYCO|nr:antibiotic transporter [Mycolicibacterium conceptionense]
MIRRLTWLAVLVVVVSGGLLGLLSGSDAASQSPVAVPADAESARADALRSEFPGGDQVPTILVVTRADGGELTMPTSTPPPMPATA